VAVNSVAPDLPASRFSASTGPLVSAAMMMMSDGNLPPHADMTLNPRRKSAPASIASWPATIAMTDHRAVGCRFCGDVGFHADVRSPPLIAHRHTSGLSKAEIKKWRPIIEAAKIEQSDRS